MKYDAALDGLRAVAVSAVVIYHANANVMPGGWAGVDIFFVLSGFLITTILTREIGETGTIDLKRFYYRRAVRLTPALALVLAVCALLVAVKPSYRHDGGIQAILFAATYTMNWARALNWGSDWKLGHTWSLGMEEQFYLLWPLILLGVRQPRARLVLTVAIIAAIVGWRCHLALSGAPVNRTYNGFDTHSDPLLIGCVLAALYTSKPMPWITVLSIPAAVAFAAILLLMPLESTLTQTAGLTLAGLVSVPLILCARQEGWLRRVLTLRPLVFTGRISYGFYLWQTVTILIVHRHLAVWAMFLPVAAAYLIAILSYYYLEQPLLRRRDRRRDVHSQPLVAS